MSPKEVLLMVGETPLGHDRSATTDNSSHSLRRQRHKAQEDSRMDRKVVYTLLCLLNQSIPKDFPIQLFCLAPHLFQGLINRHRADRYRRVT